MPEILVDSYARHRARERWGGVRVIDGAYTGPRPTPCPDCGARYRARQIVRKATWKIGQPKESIGTCPRKHADFRWPER